MKGLFISEEQGLRSLHFGSDWVQGSMRIARPWDLVLEYTREMMSPLLFLGESGPRSALMVGLGVAAMPKFMNRHFPSCRQTVVEISDAVVASAMVHFKCPEPSPNFELVVNCGAQYLMDSNRHFQFIAIDGFDGKAKSGPLNSASFYLNVRARLAPGGWAAFNVLSSGRDYPNQLSRIAEAFDSEITVLPPSESGNVVVLAHPDFTKPTCADELKRCAEVLKSNTKLNLTPTVSKLIQVWHLS